MPVTPSPEDFLGKTVRRFAPPWTVEKIPGGFKVSDANGQSLAYVYSRENDSDAQYYEDGYPRLPKCHWDTHRPTRKRPNVEGWDARYALRGVPRGPHLHIRLDGGNCRVRCGPLV